MQKVKKLPQRQCVGCRERKEKRELIRVVRSPEGGISLDFKGKKLLYFGCADMRIGVAVAE